MTQKIAFVIGGSGGIGSEIVKLLMNKGMMVCSSYHNHKPELQDINENSPAFFQLNLLHEETVSKSINQILERYGKIDVIVFSASLPIANKPVLSMTWDDYQSQIDIQLKGFFSIVQSLKPLMKTRHKIKFIVILTEACTGKPPSGLSHYVTAKYSLMGFCKSLAVELAKFNSTVNMVSPGMVQTKLTAGFPQKLIEITAESNPLKRIADPKDVAEVVAFLSDEGSDYLNGVNILVNGGGIMQ